MLAKLSDQGADFAQAAKRCAAGCAAAYAAMRAGSGLPVAGSGAEARVCSKKACAEVAPKNGKLFIAIRHSLPSLPRSTSAMLRTRAWASRP